MGTNSAKWKPIRLFPLFSEHDDVDGLNLILFNPSTTSISTDRSDRKVIELLQRILIIHLRRLQNHY
jgi:hypothetical protein